jgi:hypothetical protein
MPLQVSWRPGKSVRLDLKATVHTYFPRFQSSVYLPQVTSTASRISTTHVLSRLQIIQESRSLTNSACDPISGKDRARW